VCWFSTAVSCVTLLCMIANSESTMEAGSGDTSTEAHSTAQSAGCDDSTVRTDSDALREGHSNVASAQPTADAVQHVDERWG
jgi:hypothetical protein